MRNVRKYNIHVCLDIYMCMCVPAVTWYVEQAADILCLHVVAVCRLKI